MLNTFLSQISAAAFGTATSFIGSLFTRVTSFFTSMLGGLMNRIGQAFMSLPGLVWGGLGKLADGVKGAMGMVAGALKYSLYGIAGIVGGAVALLNKSVQTAGTWGQSLRTLSASTGLSSRPAGAVQSRFGAVGLDASQVLAGQNPALYGMRASVYGLGSYTDPNFLPSAAGRFQSLNSQGITGQMLAQQMAKSLGLGDAAGLRTLGTPVREIREQQRFSSSVRSGLGLDDSALVSATRQWQQFTGKLRVLGESVLMKLAQSALPRLNAGFDKLLKFAESRAGGIGGLIERGVNAAFEAFAKFALFLADTAPRAALTFASTFLKGLLAITEATPTLFAGLLKGIDIAQMGFDWLAKVGAGAFDLLSRGISAVSAGVSAFIQNLPQIESAFKTIIANVVAAINGILPGILPSGAGGSSGSGSVGQVGDNTRGLPGISNPDASPYTSPLGIAQVAWNAGRLLTTPGDWAGRQAAHAVGADAPWQQGVAGMAGRSVASGALLAGGRALLATPAGAVTGAAIGAAGVLGYGAFSAAQAVGLVDRDQSYLGRLGLGASRVADFVTGNSGETDRRANEQWAQDRAQAHARATGHPQASQHAGIAGIVDATSHAWNMGGARSAMGGSGILGTMHSAFDAVPQSSWSQSLEARFGASVRGGSASGSESIRNALQAVDANKAGLGNSEIVALLRELAEAMKGTERNTAQGSDSKPMFTDQQVQMMWQLVNQSMRNRATGEYLALVSR